MFYALQTIDIRVYKCTYSQITSVCVCVCRRVAPSMHYRWHCNGCHISVSLAAHNIFILSQFFFVYIDGFAWWRRTVVYTACLQLYMFPTSFLSLGASSPGRHVCPDDRIISSKIPGRRRAGGYHFRSWNGRLSCDRRRATNGH